MNEQSRNIIFAPEHDIQTPLPSTTDIHPHTFHSVFSNAVFHWCRDSPAGVLRLCRELLVRDGTGKLVVEMGGGMNMVGVRAALWAAVKKRGREPAEIDPWYFPRVEEYTRVCCAHIVIGT